MNLYFISQDVNDGYNAYDSAVVCAKSKKEAQMTHPDGSDDWDSKKDADWCDAEDVKVTKIGTANKSIKKELYALLLMQHKRRRNMESIKQILMRRDGMTEEEELIEDARNNLHERLAEGEMPYDICGEWFGLEPDFIMELTNFC